MFVDSGTFFLFLFALHCFNFGTFKKSFTHGVMPLLPGYVDYLYFYTLCQYLRIYVYIFIDKIGTVLGSTSTWSLGKTKNKINQPNKTRFSRTSGHQFHADHLNVLSSFSRLPQTLYFCSVFETFSPGVPAFCRTGTCANRTKSSTFALEAAETSAAR